MQRKFPLKRFSLFWLLLFTVPFAALATLLVLFIQPGPLKELLSGFQAQPALLWYNFLPIWLLVLALTFFLNNPFFATAIVGGVGGILSLVNRTMIEKRDEPFSPKDFALIKEAANAMGNYGMELSVSVVGTLVGFVVVFAGLGLLLGGKPLFRERWARATFRVFFGAAVSVALVACVNFVYSSPELYNSFTVTNRYYITSVYQELGFPYCFCYNFNTYLVEKPENFDKGKTEALIAETQVPETEPKAVNVVMVMNEAFSDVNDNPIFDYSESGDPLSNLKSISQEENCISGHIVVPNYGAGTANTEFDVITGMQTGLLSASGVSAFRVLNRDVNSIFRVFAQDESYHTEFIHPGLDWFYNRQNVYGYFGAQEMLFSQAFEDAHRMGQWVADDAVFEAIQQEFEESMAAGENYFNYTVTIQNHMSYGENKYGGYVVPRVKTKEPLSAEAESLLSVYTQGARDADAMLGDLTRYFSGREEPVMVVFFGDHRPLLGNDYLCYRELGIPVGETDTPENVLLTYETPYVIWVNEAASQELNFSQAKEAAQLPENGLISANYLGGLVLELTGRDGANPFFAYVNQMRKELPVYHNNVGCTADGTMFMELPDEYKPLVEKLHFWEYYRLKYE